MFANNSDSNFVGGKIEQMGIYSFKMGCFNCYVFLDNVAVFSLDMLLEKQSITQLEDQLESFHLIHNQWEISFNTLLIDTGELKVLLDTGWGTTGHRLQGTLLQKLKIINIKPSDIDVILFTHFDLDHVGDVLTVNGEATFPNARYIVKNNSWAEYQEWDIEKIPELSMKYHQKLRPFLNDKVELVEENTFFIPGFKYIPSSGHRAGHTAILVESDSAYLIHVGDAILHPIMVTYNDLHSPIHTNSEKNNEGVKTLIETANTLNATVFATHFLFPGIGKIQKKEIRYYWNAI